MALTWAYRGFDYTSYYRGGFTNADSLTALAATGANSIETTLDWGINPLTNTIYADSSYTDPLTAEAAVIHEAVAKGLQVMVKPHIDFLHGAYLQGTPYTLGDWRTYYNPGAAGSAGANAFFASYKTMILQEAAVGVANGATLLCIGTEIDQIAGPSYKSYWDDIITTLRAQDPSLKLTFAADWNDAASPWQYGGSGLPVGTGNLATQISFASELDYLGVDEYAPLSNAANPTLQQLVNGFTQAPVNSGATAGTYAVTGNQSLIHYFESVAAAVGKPLLFTEVGFENASDAGSSPAGTATNTENDALQSLAYQALFQAFSQSGDAAVAGAYLYNWDPNAAEVGPGSIAFSPQNLPALNVIKSAFAAPALATQANFADGLNISVAVPGVSLGINSTGSVFTVVLNAGNGTLTATGAATIAGSGTANLSISGSLAAVNATLAKLTYAEATAAGDTLHISASADGGPTAAATVSVVNDPSFPVLSFTAATLVSGATVNLSGTVNAVNSGRTATYFVNGAAAATALASNGTFAANLTLPTGLMNVVTAQLTDANNGVGATSPLMIGVGNGLTATFSAANGNVVNLFNATSVGDTVNGSNGYVVVHGCTTTVNGGADQIYTDASPLNAVLLTNTGGAADTLTAGGTGTVYFASAVAQVVGGAQTVDFWGGTGNSATLVNTGAAWDVTTSANGAKGTVYLDSAFTQLWGGGETAYFNSGAVNALHLVNTGGGWDNVGALNGASGTIYMTSAQAQVYGGAQNVLFWAGSGDAAHLLNTGGAWDVVTAANGTAGTVYLDSAQAQVWGGGQSVDFWGGSGDAVDLLNTGASADVVASANGASGTVFLSTASAAISGGGETVDFWSGAANTASLSGSNFAVVANLASFGLDTVNGFSASDSLYFASADQGKLMVTQSGGDTLITLDAGDVVTLKGYTGAATLAYHT